VESIQLDISRWHYQRIGIEKSNEGECNRNGRFKEKEDYRDDLSGENRLWWRIRQDAYIWQERWRIHVYETRCSSGNGDIPSEENPSDQTLIWQFAYLKTLRCCYSWPFCLIGNNGHGRRACESFCDDSINFYFETTNWKIDPQEQIGS